MLTPFEQTGTFSSIAAGEDFLEALAAAHSHVTLEKWGQPSGATLTRLGMFTVTVGTGPVDAVALGSIHGNEYSGREACMAFARDLAESTDPTMQAYLAEHSWSIMATANPAGNMLGTRDNANSIDLNRTYDDFSEAETRSIRDWMEWAVPVLAVDLHEGTDGDFAADSATGTMDPATGLAPLLPLGVDLSDTIKAALISAGRTSIAYGTIADGTIRKSGHLHWQIVAQLVEMNYTRLTPAQRVAAHTLALETALDHHRTNAAWYDTAQREAGGGRPIPPVFTGGPTIIRNGVPAPAAVSMIRDGAPVPVT